mmetsp:Transcript_30893/g.51138  ORF Transcript_30893/g.51138 Transcript_30893/m.51138 type:complete len:203 (+) Transcript_30893:1344-1952(+)
MAKPLSLSPIPKQKSFRCVALRFCPVCSRPSQRTKAIRCHGDYLRLLTPSRSIPPMTWAPPIAGGSRWFIPTLAPRDSKCCMGRSSGRCRCLHSRSESTPFSVVATQHSLRDAVPRSSSRPTARKSASLALSIRKCSLISSSIFQPQLQTSTFSILYEVRSVSEDRVGSLEAGAHSGGAGDATPTGYQSTARCSQDWGDREA